MLSDIQRRKLEHLFNVLDTNKNGLLQLDDFVAVSDEIIEHLQLDRKSRKGRVILNKASRLFIQLVVDINASSFSISASGWLKFFEKELSKSQGTGLLHHYVERTTHHLFSLFDVNRDNYISIAEYSMMLSVYKISLKDCQTSFERLDQNNDKLISVEELVHGLNDFFWSSDPQAAGNWIFGNWQQSS